MSKTKKPRSIEAMSTQMAGRSWKPGRSIAWDADQEIIVAQVGENLDEILWSGKKPAFTVDS